MSLRDRIREANDRKGEALEVPEWGLTVYVRRLSAREALDFRDWLAGLEKSEPDELKRGIALVLRTVILATVDEGGNQLFTEADQEWLAAKSQDALRRIFDKAGELAGMSREARDQIRKNSPGAGGSPADLPSPSGNGTLTASSPA